MAMKRRARGHLDPILFYGTENAYGEFSNWWPSEFELDGLRWATAEHYFMAQKTKNKRERERIRRAPTLRRAKELGRMVRLRRGWDGMKFEVMLKACTAKFTKTLMIPGGEAARTTRTAGT